MKRHEPEVSSADEEIKLLFHRNRRRAERRHQTRCHHHKRGKSAIILSRKVKKAYRDCRIQKPLKRIELDNRTTQAAVVSRRFHVQLNQS